MKCRKNNWIFFRWPTNPPPVFFNTNRPQVAGKIYTLMKRDFTGVFIPAKIWCDESLIPAEKMLLGEVKALSERTGWCTANNRHFSTWLHCSLPNVSMYINGLAKKGYLMVEYDNEKTKSGRKMQVNSTWYHGIQSDLTPLSHIEGGLSHIEAPLSVVEAPLSHIEAEIQYKYNLNPSVSEAPAPELQNPSLEEEKDPPQFPADPPPQPGYNDRPKAETPTELQAALSAFYNAHPGEWELHMEKFGRASMQLWGRRPNDFEKQQAFEGYCAFAIENGRANHTYQAQNARLRRWFADQPTMQKPAQPQPAKEQASGPNYRRLN